MSINEYKYFKEDETLFRIHIEQDEDAESPREWDSNIGTMVCWHKNYNLGDEHNFSSPEDFLNNLVRDNIKETTIINFIKKKKASNGLELRYSRKAQLWELWGYYYWSLFGESREPKFGVLESSNLINYLVDDIIEAMSFEDKWKLLERHAGIVFLPLYLYDHSGITMNTKGFSCAFDSGQVGYIYTTKEKVLKEVGCYEENGKWKKAKTNWRNAAYANLESEVKTYDMYLQNEVYGFVVEEFDSDDNWGEVESSWGFFSDNYGDALIEEIAREYTNETLYDSKECAA